MLDIYIYIQHKNENVIPICLVASVFTVDVDAPFAPSVIRLVAFPTLGSST